MWEPPEILELLLHLNMTIEANVKFNRLKSMHNSDGIVWNLVWKIGDVGVSTLSYRHVGLLAGFTKDVIGYWMNDLSAYSKPTTMLVGIRRIRATKESDTAVLRLRSQSAYVLTARRAFEERATRNIKLPQSSVTGLEYEKRLNTAAEAPAYRATR
ncbi:hypothetical protein PLEOSDRAFT_1072172 [Pleurotus ostreatus PC15]|uniref:Uncharacterized protein n=1 Tax=Pleurotus ostreatus (strain PC15) TaxID=1137138 RepID=A0A067N991_PLEO1|nr:hypothetical protein PLEOSDRAFT_1072172 [Pleurotus ostreatus PC15]